MPEIPRRNLYRIMPKTNSPSPGITFGLGVETTVGCRLFSLVLLVMPCQTGMDLPQICVLTINDDLADGPAISIGLARIYGDRFSEDQIAEVLLGAVSECLGFFRGIDASQANLVLCFIAVQYGNRIAVTNADHRSLKSFAI